MAFGGGDALCGPSSAFKSLSDNFERDRSLTQDRLRQVQSGGLSTFKSVSEPSHNADYRAFMNNGANGIAPLPNGHHSLPLIPGAPIQQQLGGAVGPAQSMHASGPAAERVNWWTGEYNAMNNDTNNLVTRPPVASPIAPPINQAPVHRITPLSPPVALTATRPYVPGPIRPFGLGYAHPIGIEHDPFVDHSVFTQARPEPLVDTGMTEAELQASFDRFEALEEDFTDEMHSWMMQHGPHAEAEQELEEQRLDLGMERLADDLDQAHLRGDPGLFAEDARIETTEEKSVEESNAQDTDLSRTAAQIIDSTAATSATNDKFKNSAFLNLMRRVASSDIILKDDKLVDSKTGMPATSVSEPAGQSTSAPEVSSGQGRPSPEARGRSGGASSSEDKGKGKAVDDQLSPSQH